ncbi:hypothetical protein CH352_14065 [Leptospira hartskeerlii]|uniref:Dolichyl-phosphate-mannose--protein mannosyltransferase n=1 Tax=Leptospira hartskeerlii TaxID=2023177 RepID=A0A2M9X9Z1_9LEPT|nr:hypothetical protein [Leptospira hartskeerlii]PJZ24464.1 hypothetical protein CH357_15440 [Leptospira hartskeerlii]PJZ32924.1 hypothetical protein CH352_14065 [Leptospira hartskeerlii]
MVNIIEREPNNWQSFVGTSTILLFWAFPLALFPIFFERSDIWLLCGAFFLSLSFYIVFLKFFSVGREKIGIWAGILLRICFLFTPVFLSEDTFRFLWDGLLVSEGLSPYSELPSNVNLGLNQDLEKELLSKMNSPNYYSVYPPILQFLFLVPAFFLKRGLSVFWAISIWKIILILFELGILYIYSKRKKEEGSGNFLKYWLHPLVLWEGIGNGHPEPILFFFLFAGILSWEKGKVFRGFVFYLASILTKILPLLALPFLFFYWCRRSTARKILLFLGACFLIFGSALIWVLFSETGERILEEHWRKGIGVYFTLFEFHGGFYYLLKNLIKYTWYPYSTGIVLGILSILTICFYSFRISKIETGNKTAFLLNVWIHLCGIYYLFSSTVHPWYFLPILAASIFTKTIWPLVASGIWILSYSTYSSFPYYDRNWVLVLEHFLVLGTFFLENFLLLKDRRGPKYFESSYLNFRNHLCSRNISKP